MLKYLFKGIQVAGMFGEAAADGVITPQEGLDIGVRTLRLFEAEVEACAVERLAGMVGKAMEDGVITYDELAGFGKEIAQMLHVEIALPVRVEPDEKGGSV